MRFSLCLTICSLSLAATAPARMRESPEDCHQRYGASVTNYPGHGHLHSVAVYAKDDIATTVFFTREPGANARASMVIYSRHRPDIRNVFFYPSEITEAEQTTLLATVPGRWENYDPPAKLAPSPGQPLPLSTQPSITTKHRDATAEAVRKAVEALYHRTLLPGLPPRHIAHNGPKLFAFRAARGVVICSYDAVKPISAWADQIISERTNTLPPANLSGF